MIREGAAAAAPEEVAATLPESLTWGTEAVARILAVAGSSLEAVGSLEASVAYLACRPSPGSRAAAAAAECSPSEEVLLKAAAAGSRAVAAESNRARP